MSENREQGPEFVEPDDSPKGPVPVPEPPVSPGGDTDVVLTTPDVPTEPELAPEA